MHTLTALSLTTLSLIPHVISASSSSFPVCGTFQTLSTDSQVNANTSASTYNSTFAPLPVSDTIQCNSSTIDQNAGKSPLCNATQCELRSVPNVFVNISRQLNISVSESVADSIFSLIKDDFVDPENVNTNASWVYNTGGGFSTVCLSEGQTGYWGYTPGMSCVTGQLGNCQSGMGVDNGTVIFACGVLTREGTAGDEVPLLGYGYLDRFFEAEGAPGRTLVNATPVDEDGSGGGDTNGAVGGMDVVQSRTWTVTVLVGLVAMGLAL